MNRKHTLTRQLSHCSLLPDDYRIALVWRSVWVGVPDLHPYSDRLRDFRVESWSPKLQSRAWLRRNPRGSLLCDQSKRSPPVTNLVVRKVLQTICMRMTRSTVQMFKRWDNFPYNALDVHGLSVYLYLCDAVAV